MRVTFQDAYEQIVAGSASASTWVKYWRRKYSAIAPSVESFVHQHLFKVTVDEVDAALHRGSHALGDVDRSSQIFDVEHTQKPPRAIQDLFHGLLERNRAVPSCEEFRSFLNEPKQKALLLTPWRLTLRPRIVGKYAPDRIRDAMRWRIGKMYYSKLRELDFLARMRERHNIYLRYHIFADVRLRTDFWIKNHNISVFLSNVRFRGQGLSSKEKAEKFLRDRQPPFQFHEVESPNRYDRGQLYRVADEEIDRLARTIRECQSYGTDTR